MYLNRIRNKIEEEYKNNNVFLKELDKLEYNKVFLYCPASLSECWNNMGAMLDKSLKRVSKNRDKTFTKFMWYFP